MLSLRRAIGVRTAVLCALLAATALLLLPGAHSVAAAPGADKPIGPEQSVVRDLPAVSWIASQDSANRAAPRRPAPGRLTGTKKSSAPQASRGSSDSVQALSAGGAPTILANRFEGVDNGDNLSTSGFTLTPPDPQVAAGPSHVVEMVNVTGRIFDKHGAVLQTFSLRDFFQVPSGWGESDPRILYDAASGRFFAAFISYLDNAGSATDFTRLHVAVSKTSDPTGVWDVYYVPYTNTLPDYDGIGITSDKFTVSANIYDLDGQHLVAPCAPPEGYCGEQTVVIEKADLLAGVAATTYSFPLNTDRFSVRPAQSTSPVSDQYLATFDVATTFPSPDVTVIRITGTPSAGNVAEASAQDFAILVQDSPPASVTAGSGTIDSGDFRMLETHWNNGVLWATASAACTPPNDTKVRSCAHLIAVDTSAHIVTQDIMFGEANQYYSWPAARSDPAGDVLVSLTHTSATIFAEAVASGRLAGDLPNTLAGTTALRTGDVVHTSTRWGDYLGAAVDPVDPFCVWLVGEYAKATPGADWGTYVAEVTYSPTCEDDDADGRLNNLDNCPNWPNPAQNLPGWTVPANDPDCDGFSTTNEQRMGTKALSHCGATPAANDEPAPDAWPYDFNDDQVASLPDILRYIAVFNAAMPSPQYNPRFDLNGDGKIGLSDVLAFVAVFNNSCA